MCINFTVEKFRNFWTFFIFMFFAQSALVLLCRPKSWTTIRFRTMMCFWCCFGSHLLEKINCDVIRHVYPFLEPVTWPMEIFSFSWPLKGYDFQLKSDEILRFWARNLFCSAVKKFLLVIWYQNKYVKCCPELQLQEDKKIMIIRPTNHWYSIQMTPPCFWALENCQ